MSRELMKDNYNALLETGSLLGHDLSGQYHVIQFCIDELVTRPLDEQTQRFIGRINESVQELIRLTEQARRVFRDSTLPNCDQESERGLRDIIELACGHYYIHAAKSWPALEIHVSGDQSITCKGSEQLYWFMVIPTLMARIQLALKNGNTETLQIKIENDGNDMSKWQARISVGQLALLGNLKDTGHFVGEREKRFAWGAEMLIESLAGKGQVHCKQDAMGLLFTNH